MGDSFGLPLHGVVEKSSISRGRAGASLDWKSNPPYPPCQGGKKKSPTYGRIYAATTENPESMECERADTFGIPLLWEVRHPYGKIANRTTTVKAHNLPILPEEIQTESGKGHRILRPAHPIQTPARMRQARGGNRHRRGRATSDRRGGLGQALRPIRYRPSFLIGSIRRFIQRVFQQPLSRRNRHRNDDAKEPWADRSVFTSSGKPTPPTPPCQGGKSDSSQHGGKKNAP